MPRATWRMQPTTGHLRYEAEINGHDCITDYTIANGFYLVYVEGVLVARRSSQDRARNAASWFAHHPEDIRPISATPNQQSTIRQRARPIVTLPISTNIILTQELYPISNRRYGVEIEIDGCDIRPNQFRQHLQQSGSTIEVRSENYSHNTCPRWKIVPDATVSWGELVSPILQGRDTDGLIQIREICRVLNQQNAVVNTRTGLHVHFDANDINQNHFRTLCVNQVHSQAYTDTFVASSRRGDGNQYCHNNVLPNVTGSLQDAFRTMCPYYKYHKMNVQCYSRQGTIEFRQHQGTTDPVKICHWITYLDAFLNASINGIAVLPHTGSSRISRQQLQDYLSLINCPSNTAEYLVRRAEHFLTLARPESPTSTPARVVESENVRIEPATYFNENDSNIFRPRTIEERLIDHAEEIRQKENDETHRRNTSPYQRDNNYHLP